MDIPELSFPLSTGLQVETDDSGREAIRMTVF